MLKDLLNRIDFQKQALDVSSLRQDVIANNIANVETPNYKSKKVVFESILEDRMQAGIPMAKTNKLHMDTGFAGKPCYIQEDRSFSNRIDKNNVNIDVEMANQAKNQITYNALVTQVSGQIRRMKLAIKGGR